MTRSQVEAAARAIWRCWYPRAGKSNSLYMGWNDAVAGKHWAVGCCRNAARAAINAMKPKRATKPVK